MKTFLLGLALLFAVVFFQGMGTASAASLTQTDIVASTVAGDDAIVKVQGYGGGGGYDRDRRRDDDDDGYRERRRDHDNDRYQERRHYEHGGRREYCFNCARRCDYGFCPPRCWGWRNYCRRDRGY